MSDVYLKRSEVCRLLNICPKTLFQWTHSGKISYIKTKGGQYRYPKKDIVAPEENTLKKNFCYCRVSTRGQSDDLQRQAEFFADRYPDHIIIRDIGSGLNFKRKGFQTLLDEAIKGNIGEIVVTHRDRLCRFSFDLLESILSKCSDGKIVVLHQRETSPQQELITDLLSIITVFSSRLYGLRSHSIKKELQDKILENTQGEVSSDEPGERETPVDDGTVSLVL